MKFKVLKGTALFDKFVAMQKEMTRCDDASLALMKELGGTRVRGSASAIAGGMSSIALPEKPAGWRNSYSGVKGEYMPMESRAGNKEILAKISALPLVKEGDLNKLVKFNPSDHDGNRLSFIPSVNWGPEYVLIKIGDQYPRYKPQEGMVEITTTEYNQLKAALETKKEK